MAGRPFGAFDSSPLRTQGNVDPYRTFVSNGMRPQNIASLMQQLSHALFQKKQGQPSNPSPQYQPLSGPPQNSIFTPSAQASTPGTQASTGTGVAPPSGFTPPPFTPGMDLPTYLQQIHANFALNGQTGDMPYIQSLQAQLQGGGTPAVAQTPAAAQTPAVQTQMPAVSPFQASHPAAGGASQAQLIQRIMQMLRGLGGVGNGAPGI